MKIAFFDIQHPWEKRLFQKLLRGHDLSFFKESLSDANVKLAANMNAVSVFIYSDVNKSIVEKLNKVKLLVTRSTGFDHIDIKTCKKKKITVCNIPFYGENTVAEHTFALILSLSRNIHKSYVRTIRNDFSIEGLKGFDLKGRTLGVVGAGRIGLHVIRIARGFGMEVVTFDTKPDTFLADVLGFTYLPFEDVLKQSDIVTLHVPYNKYTHNLINKNNIGLMKKGAVLINTARGAIVDTKALIKALDSGHLSGAGLDVIEGENLMRDEKQLLNLKSGAKQFADLFRDHILLHLDNVVFTPHIAFYSQEALERIIQGTADNILAFINKSPQMVVK